mgnify:CR=1 FL=1
MLEVPNEKAEVVSNATIYAVKILNEVKASYAAFAEKDFGTDSISNIFWQSPMKPRKKTTLCCLGICNNQIILKFLTFHLKTTQLILM